MVAGVQIAIFVYEHMRALDAIGPYEIVSRLPGVETIVVGERRGPVRCDTGCLALVADAALDDVTAPDLLVVPGWSGAPQDHLLCPGPVQDWVRAVDGHTTWTASAGTGAIILAAAGLLTGRRATTQWLAVDWLAELDVVPAGGRVVQDGKYLTAAGASGGIEMGLTLPIYEQFWIWFAKAAAADFGKSIAFAQPVSRLIGQALPATIELVLVAAVFATIIGLAGGLLMYRLAGGRGEAASDLASTLIMSIPEFLWAIFFILLFGVALNILPFTGRLDLPDGTALASARITLKPVVGNEVLNRAEEKASTDDEGFLQVEGVMPGLEYLIAGEAGQSRRTGEPAGEPPAPSWEPFRRVLVPGR